MWESIVNAFKSFLQRVKNFFRKIINGILNFFRDVVSYFKGLRLRQGTQVPFIANREKFKEMLHNAPVKNVGIFSGVYNEVTDEIENVQDLQADALDAQTKQVLGNEELVVLS
ncbi:MAG: hypothetical protein ACI4AM_03740 [Muribaculaceae bacterium]